MGSEKLMHHGDTQGQRCRTRAREHRAIPMGVQAEPRSILAGRSSYVSSASIWGLPKTIELIGIVDSTALKQPVPPMSVAKSILFLASEVWSGHVTGQILNVDCGKQGKVMWMKQEAAESNVV